MLFWSVEASRAKIRCTYSADSSEFSMSYFYIIPDSEADNYPEESVYCSDRHLSIIMGEDFESW